jgi:hypothetical protein
MKDRQFYYNVFSWSRVYRLEIVRIMKRALCLLLATIAIFSCSEDQDTRPSSSFKGKWIWKSTCGGFIGCTYASGSASQELMIGDSVIFQRQNGKLIWSDTYVLKNVSTNGDSVVFELEMSDGTTWICTVTHNELSVEFLSVMYSVYRRTA